MESILYSWVYCYLGFINYILCNLKRNETQISKEKGIIIILFIISRSNYLRFHNGIWHVTIGFMSFYLWYSKIEEDFGWTDFWKKPRLNIYSYYGVANS